MEILEEAVREARGAITTTPENHLDHAMRLNDLSNDLTRLYRRTGEFDTLQEAIHIARQAVDKTSKDDRDLALHLNNLGVKIADLYMRTKNAPDIEEAVEVLRQSVVAATEDDPNRAMFLNNLSGRLAIRFTHIGLISDLEEAIHINIQAVAVASEDNPKRATYMSSLATKLHQRFLRKGAINDLDEAIKFAEQAVAMTPDNHEELLPRLNNLGIVLGARYSRNGEMADLDEAIRALRKSVAATPEGHPDRASRLHNLGGRLAIRYLRMRALVDIEEAVGILRRSVAATPESHASYPMRLNSLASSLSDCYSRTGDMVQLEEAVQVASQALAATPRDHPHWPKRLNSLGNQLRERFLKKGGIADIEEAIQNARNAVAGTPEDHPDRALYLTNLGIRLGSLYSRSKAASDVDEAILAVRRAVEQTPKDHLSRAHRVNTLASLLIDRYSQTASMTDVEEAVSLYQLTLQAPNSTILSRIEAGKAVLRYCSDWRQGYEASSIATRLIPKLPARSLENFDKQHILIQVVGVASDAAAAALRVDEPPHVALDLLEHGRGILGASLEDLRVDILELKERDSTRAEEFIHLREDLEQSADLRTPSSLSRRYDAGKEFDQLVAEIRRLPGFEDFLLPPSEADLHAAARDGPIVVLNVSELRCDALLVEVHQMRTLPLASLSKDDIEQKAKLGNLGSRQVLEWLWDTVACPVLDSLGFTRTPSENDWPHIWWIPTGLLCKFPIHAAGYHNQHSGETVLDRVMSSYASSMKSIAYGRRRMPPPPSGKALLVAMEHTPEHSVLPYATQEVAMLQGLCRTLPFDPVQPPPHKQEVTSQLRDCNIFHFAGHGYTDDLDPSKSRLLLNDWQKNPLRVADLLEMNLRERSPFLAYLSACGTGQITDERFIDESIHLISACQLAGFRHVIGTLWEVNDKFCVDMARITYEGMRDGDMTDESVCQGLHNASRQLRDRWLFGQLRGSETSNTLKDMEFVVPQMNVSHEHMGKRKEVRLPRDVQLDDDTGDEGIGASHWAPYVHFGV